MKKRHKVIYFVAGGFVALLVLVVALAPDDVSGGGATLLSPSTGVVKPTTAAPVATADHLTRAQRNAIGEAESYLNYTAFSRSGLIDQLEYEGYSTSDATFAVDSLDVDWKEQAVLSGLSYLEYSTFSLPGLISQLEYEGYSKAEATYGAGEAYSS